MRARATAALTIVAATLATGCLVLNPGYAEDTSVDLTEGANASS